METRSITFMDYESDPERLLSKSDISSIESDDSLSPPPPTIPIRKRSLVERRNVQLSNVIIGGDVKMDNAASSSSNDVSPLLVTRARSLRRNSISMPTGLNKINSDAVQQQKLEDILHSQVSDTSIANIDVPKPERAVFVDVSSALDSSDAESDKVAKRTQFRTKRRLSVAPLPSLRLNSREMLANELDGQSMVSNQNSVTSVNSLASLLKEKMQNFPSMIRRKKHVTSDLKIKAFVSLLFLIIVFLVGYAYIMYHQKVLARMYFDRVKFDKNNRKIKVFDSFNQEKITGKLGKNIISAKPFHCLDKANGNNGSFCLEWDSIARLYMSYEQKGAADCYAVRWQSLDINHYPEDCYDFTASKGHWYGGGITKGHEWPFDETTFEFTPFITGDASTHQFGNALKRYFISSAGVSIQIDDKTPLYINMNAEKTPGQFCMKAMNDNFAFVNRLTDRPELNYKICIAPNMKMLHQQLTQQSLWDGLKESDIQIVHSILEEPVWQIAAANIDQLSESSIYNYTEQVIDMGFLRLGHVLINEFWQKEIGDFTVDVTRFATLENTVNILQRRGFKVVLTIQPFISTNSANFANSVSKKYLIYERLSERTIPALTRYKGSPSSGVIDVTNNASIPWLVNQLNAIVKTYKINAFYIDYGTAYNIPHYYQCSKSLINPDQYKSTFTGNIVEHLPIFGVSGAVTVPKPPAFLGLPPVNSSWEGLQSIVTTALSYGVIGYPFILPGPVGGDYLLPSGNLTTILSYRSWAQPPLPEPELFIRWLQLATFLPSIRYSHLPSEYKSNVVTEVAKELTNIRQKTVITILKKYVNDAMNEGIPLVRPLWMLDIYDPACLVANDEFSIGEELIVAPILNKGQTKREVYLPQGVWKDGIDGSLRKGSRWIHNYRVPLEKVAHFIKMPDNTRF